MQSSQLCMLFLNLKLFLWRSAFKFPSFFRKKDFISFWTSEISEIVIFKLEYSVLIVYLLNFRSEFECK